MMRKLIHNHRGRLIIPLAAIYLLTSVGCASVNPKFSPGVWWPAKGKPNGTAIQASAQRLPADQDLAASEAVRQARYVGNGQGPRAVAAAYHQQPADVPLTQAPSAHTQDAIAATVFDETVRGQGYSEGAVIMDLLHNPWFIGGLAVAAIVIPLAIDDSGTDRPAGG